MTDLQPSVDGHSPYELVPVHMQGLFKRHYVATNRCTSLEEFLRAVSLLSVTSGGRTTKLTGEDRNAIAQVYTELRENGWHPMGLDKFGNIKWAYRVSKPIDLSDLPESMTPDEAKEYLNNNFCRIGEDISEEYMEAV